MRLADPPVQVVAFLLLASFAVLVMGVLVLALTGRLEGAYGQPGDPQVSFFTNWWMMRLANASMILAVLGLGLLSARLWSETATPWAFAGLACVVLAGMGWIVEISLTFGIAEIASAETAQTGAIPGYAQALKIWVNQALQPSYVLAGMLASISYGIGLLQTQLVPVSVSWILVGWGVFWGALALGGTLTIPAVILISAAIAGAGLLL